MIDHNKKPRFIKPPNKLKMKVGTGGIEERLLDDAQTYIQQTKINFKPIAENLLKDVMNALKAARNAKQEHEKKEAADNLAGAIMQLKANGGMFNYQLISEIAALALHFLENSKINPDALQVIDVHAKTIHIILHHDLKGDGGKEGYALVKELENACERYFSKHKA